ncbi:MAG TPA: SRPBCC family protein [Gemmatimonadaceae bacterium]|nr:SRPBCC family protein [Gemmatimonadaceae bacterium]
MNGNPRDRSLALLGGLGLGALLMYLFDPDRGKRRRHMVRDKAVRALHVSGDALDATGRDLRNRAQGAAAELRARTRKDEPGDEVIVQRVRAELGRTVAHPSSVIATSENGIVTLSGPILAREADRLLAAVKRVRSVRDVVDQLDRREDAGHVPGLQGGTERTGDRMELLQENWAPAARLFTGLAGGAVALYGARRRGMVGAALGAAGAALLARSATNVEVRRLVGAGGGGRAVEIQKTITLELPVEQVYTFFTDYENFPQFMSHVREVRDLGDGRSHWVVDGVAGVPVEWDAVITRAEEHRELSWKSTDQSAVQHAGTMRFEPTQTGGTRVDIKMWYNPPAGAAGHAVSKLFRVDPKKQMDDDLARVKTALETGTPPHDAAALRP